MLAKRLIHTLSVSMDAEEGMISRLKVSCHSIALTASYAKPVPGNGTRVIWQRGRRRRAKKSPCAFFASVSQFVHIFILELGTDHWIISIWDWVGGGGGGGCALYHSTIHSTTYFFCVKPTHFAEPHPFHHFELISIQWGPLNLFVVVFVVAACVWLWIYKQASSYVYRDQHQLRCEF